MTEPQQPTPPPVAWPVPKPASNAPYVAIGIGIGVVVILPVIVAIIGILAAIAIPNFLRYSLRAKTSEAKVNVKQLAAGELAHFAEHGRFVALSRTPTPTKPDEKVAFEANEATQLLRFDPGPTVRYSYEVEVTPDGKRAVVRATGDLDRDGEPATYRLELDGASMGRLEEPDRNTF